MQAAPGRDQRHGRSRRLCRGDGRPRLDGTCRRLNVPDTRGKPRVDDRRVISGIVHVLKSGGRWIDAPDDYGPHKTLYNRFVRWAEKGVWVKVFYSLASTGGPAHEF